MQCEWKNNTSSEVVSAVFLSSEVIEYWWNGCGESKGKVQWLRQLTILGNAMHCRFDSNWDPSGCSHGCRHEMKTSRWWKAINNGTCIFSPVCCLNGMLLFYSIIFFYSIRSCNKLHRYIVTAKSIPSMYCTNVRDKQLLRYQQKMTFVFHN